MQLKGTLKLIRDIQQVSEKFSKREFVITTNEQYPQTIQLELQGNNVDIIDAYGIGEEVVCDLNLRGRAWTNKEGKEVYFNTIVAWKIQKPNESQGQGTASEYAPPTSNSGPIEYPQANQTNSFVDGGGDDDKNGLPF